MKMAERSSSAVPATSMETGRALGDDSTTGMITSHVGPTAERTVSLDESMTRFDADDEDLNEDYDYYPEEMAPAPAVVTPETPEDPVMSAGRGSKWRDLADERDDVNGRWPGYAYPEEAEAWVTTTLGQSKRCDDDSRPAGASYRSDDDSSSGDNGSAGDEDSQLNDYLRELSEVAESELQDATPRIGLAAHRPLGQIKTFTGVRNQSDNSMQWLRAFVYEMKGTKAAPNEWCMPFELSLRDCALHWHRQLPVKTKQTWSLLSAAFIRYYCSHFSLSAEARYYSAKRSEKEHICDYLNRLNGYARNAGIQFEDGSREARDHVKRFLETCDDQELERRLCHLRISDIYDLEERITEILKLDAIYSSRDFGHRTRAPAESRRPNDHRAAEACRRDERSDTSRWSVKRTDESCRLDDWRNDEPYRSYDNHARCGRREISYERQLEDSRNMPGVALADASMADLLAEIQERDNQNARRQLPSTRGQAYSSQSSEPDSNQGFCNSWFDSDDWSGGYSSEGSGPYHVMTNDQECRAAADDTKAPDRQHRGDRASPSNETGVVPTGLPELAEPAIEAECIFAFVGTCEWADGDNGTCSSDVETEESLFLNGIYGREGLGNESVRGDAVNRISSAQRDEQPRRELALEVQLLPGERLGWWAAKQFDRRVRMRTLVNGAVNDTRTRILLDTGANVSVISARFARKLRLQDISGHGRCMEVQGITNGKTTTTRRASVKITLGWERVYVFEVWIMKHNAGVDVVLGTDFMIPAGVRLDLLRATAKLPDEVAIPLIKTQNTLDEPVAPQIDEGPNEPLEIPGREWREFRVRRKQPSPLTHELWVRRTEKLIPTVTSFRKKRPSRVRLTNLTDKLTNCPAHLPMLAWVPVGALPRAAGYVRLDSEKYKEWQVLAYAASRDKTLLSWEAELYTKWLASQPPAVERATYPTPTRILRRPIKDAEGDNNNSVSYDNRDAGSDGLQVGDDPEPTAQEHSQGLSSSTIESTVVSQPAHISTGTLDEPKEKTSASEHQVSCIQIQLGPKKSTSGSNAITRADRDYDSSGASAMIEHSFVSLVNSLDTRRHLSPTRELPTTRAGPKLLAPRLPKSHTGFVVSFGGSAEAGKETGSCAWIVWRLPEWQIAIAASAYLDKATINAAELMGLTNGVLAAFKLGADDLVVVGSSRLAIQQSLGVSTCRDESLTPQQSRHREIMARLRSVKYLHLTREHNAAADSLATEALKSKITKVVLSPNRKAELCELNRIPELIHESTPEKEEGEIQVSGSSFQILDSNNGSQMPLADRTSCNNAERVNLECSKEKIELDLPEEGDFTLYMEIRVFRRSTGCASEAHAAPTLDPGAGEDSSVEQSEVIPPGDGSGSNELARKFTVEVVIDGDNSLPSSFKLASAELRSRMPRAADMA